MEIFVVLNPVAGRSQAAQVKKALAKYLASEAANRLRIYETTGAEDVADLVRGAVANGAELVIAAGGDGTVSAVVDGLMGFSIPLGIIPTGTTNVLAQELGLPLNVERACQVLVNRPQLRAIDALEFRGRYYLLSVGTGLDALAVEGTSREGKRRIGRLAYVWSILKVVVGFQPHTFTLILDGKTKRIHAADILLANTSVVTRPFRWGPHIRPDDGRIDICIMRARNILDILGVVFDIILPDRPRRERNLQYLSAHHSVMVFADRPLLVQGDGEVIGETPIEVTMVPGAIQILVGQKIGLQERLKLPSLPIQKKN